MSTSYAALLLAMAVAARPLAGQEAGLLLGYAHGERYHTLWLTMAGDRAEVVAELPDLLVPGGSGFTRVGIATLCDDDGTRQVVWQARPGETPALPGTPCPEPADGEASAEADADAEEPAGCDSHTAAIWFVSPGWISENYTFSQTEECEPRGGRWRDSSAVRRLEQRAPVSLAALIGPRAAEEYASAIAEGYVELSREMNCPEPYAEEYDLASWLVQHQRGGWRGVAAYNEYMGECAVWGEIAAPLPRALVGTAAAPAISLDTAAYRDWVASPDGRYVVALRTVRRYEVQLEVYTLRRGRPDRRLLERPIGSQTRIVMAEWATGAHVGRWTGVVRACEPAGARK